MTALYHYLEASRLAFADRNRYVGDPRYVGVPLPDLLAPGFAATRRCLIGTTAPAPGAPGQPYPPYGDLPARRRTQPAAEAAHQPPRHRRPLGQRRRLHQHDQLLGGTATPCPGYGFLLNNEMTDFDFAPLAAGAATPTYRAGASSRGPA